MTTSNSPARSPTIFRLPTELRQIIFDFAFGDLPECHGLDFGPKNYHAFSMTSHEAYRATRYYSRRYYETDGFLAPDMSVVERYMSTNRPEIAIIQDLMIWELRRTVWPGYLCGTTPSLLKLLTPFRNLRKLSITDVRYMFNLALHHGIQYSQGILRALVQNSRGLPSLRTIEISSQVPLNTMDYPCRLEFNEMPDWVYSFQINPPTVCCPSYEVAIVETLQRVHGPYLLESESCDQDDGELLDECMSLFSATAEQD